MKKKTKEEIAQAEEINTYQKNGFLSKIPYWVKAVLIKYWFFGVICFFVLMGLGLVISNPLDRIVVCGLLGGMITDVVTDNILIMIESSDRESQWFMIYKKPKSVLSLVVNLVYCLVLFFGCSELMTLIISTYSDKSIWFLQEPCSQALVLIIVDMAFIGIKDLILYELIKHNYIKPKNNSK